MHKIRSNTLVIIRSIILLLGPVAFRAQNSTIKIFVFETPDSSCIRKCSNITTYRSLSCEIYSYYKYVQQLYGFDKIAGSRWSQRSSHVAKISRVRVMYTPGHIVVHMIYTSHTWYHTYQVPGIYPVPGMCYYWKLPQGLPLWPRTIETNCEHVPLLISISFHKSASRVQLPGKTSTAVTNCTIDMQHDRMIRVRQQHEHTSSKTSSQRRSTWYCFVWLQIIKSNNMATISLQYPGTYTNTYQVIRLRDLIQKGTQTASGGVVISDAPSSAHKQQAVRVRTAAAVRTLGMRRTQVLSNDAKYKHSVEPVQQHGIESWCTGSSIRTLVWYYRSTVVVL